MKINNVESRRALVSFLTLPGGGRPAVQPFTYGFNYIVLCGLGAWVTRWALEIGGLLEVQ